MSESPSPFEELFPSHRISGTAGIHPLFPCSLPRQYANELSIELPIRKLLPEINFQEDSL